MFVLHNGYHGIFSLFLQGHPPPHVPKHLDVSHLMLRGKGGLGGTRKPRGHILKH